MKTNEDYKQNIDRNLFKVKIFIGNILDSKFLTSYSLIFLNISHNGNLQNHTLFIPNLIIFDLSHNILKKNIKFNYIKLTNLYLKYTNLIKIPLINCTNLLYLDISGNKIEYLDKKSFLHSTKLNELIATNLNIKSIEMSSFGYKNNLEILHLNNTILRTSINHEFLLKLTKLKKIFTEEYSICCLFKKFGKNYKNCINFRQNYSSCTNLLISHVLRIILWFYVIFGFLGNFSAIIIYITLYKKEKIYSKPLLLLSDIGIFMYLIIIGLYDYLNYSTYMKIDISWRNTNHCLLSGLILWLSILCTNFFSILKSIEKLDKMNCLSYFWFKKSISLPFSCFCFFTLCFISLSPYFISRVCKSYDSKYSLCIEFIFRQP